MGITIRAPGGHEFLRGAIVGVIVLLVIALVL